MTVSLLPPRISFGWTLPSWLILVALDTPSVPGAQQLFDSQGHQPDASFPLLYRSSGPGPNMLDGLKMEENFQSAIETSASFSSLLGEYEGRALWAHPLSPCQSSGSQLLDQRRGY